MSGRIALELGRVAHLELVHPPLNLVSGELLAELDIALATLAATSAGDVRAVVVSGGERAFSAGSRRRRVRGTAWPGRPGAP